MIIKVCQTENGVNDYIGNKLKTVKLFDEKTTYNKDVEKKKHLRKFCVCLGKEKLTQYKMQQNLNIELFKGEDRQRVRGVKTNDRKFNLKLN